MSAFIDLTGERYGRLTVICLGERNADKTVTWVCKCDCGNTITVRRHDLRSGNTKSCGCYHSDRTSETTSERMRAAGFRPRTETQRLLNIWARMKQRCKNPNCTGYEYYGGRGISVCKEWESFDCFCDWAMANGYDKDAKRGECTLDRIDVNGDYEPSNFRWVSMKVQRSNQRPRRRRAII